MLNPPTHKEMLFINERVSYYAIKWFPFALSNYKITVPHETSINIYQITTYCIQLSTVSCEQMWFSASHVKCYFHPHVRWLGLGFWKHFRSDMFFLLAKCHWQVLTWKLKLAVSNLSYCICKQLTFPSLSLRERRWSLTADKVFNKHPHMHT